MKLKQDYVQSMGYKLIVQPSAEYDLDEHIASYEKKQIGLGASFLDNFLEKLKLIEENPYKYQIKYREVRKVMIKRFPFAIHFIIEESAIHIIAVHPDKSDPANWQRDI